MSITLKKKTRKVTVLEDELQTFHVKFERNDKTSELIQPNTQNIILKIFFSNTSFKNCHNCLKMLSSLNFNHSNNV